MRLPSFVCVKHVQRVLRVLALVIGLGLVAWPAQALPSFAEVRSGYHSSETLILSREGDVLQRLRTDASMRRGAWVALADISPALQRAMLFSEDKRFYQHSGVDWSAVSAAAWGNLWHQRTRGASTITMQLAGLLDDDWAQSAGGRSVVEKLGQTVAAQVLDRRWRKDQILEAYLNLVPFRGELVGIDALSRTLFDKAAHGLDEREAAIAAVLVRAPNASAAHVARRACALLRELRAGAVVDCAALQMFASAALAHRAFAASEGVAPHFARLALAQALQPGGAKAPARLRTTLSGSLQRMAQQTLQRHLRELAGRHVQDGAIVVLDNASGQVLAWVGSSEGLSRAADVDGVLALRQPGSALKPFLYAQAIAQRRLTAASLIHDSPAQISTSGGLYIPQNYDHRFKGWVSARTALASSLNVPAVRTLVMVTPDAFATQLRDLGLALPEPAGYYGYSLALGASEVRLLDLANAYRALANGGRYSPVAPGLLPTGRQTAPPQQGRSVLDAGAAFIVGNILADSNARVPTFGADSVLNTRFWSAVKTGTSKDMRDNWAVGWSQRYTVGVWVGNADGSPMHEVSGSSGAAPVWAEVMGWLHRSTSSRAPQAPPGVHRIAVHYGPGRDGLPLASGHEEWFMPGTEQALFAIKNVSIGDYQESADANNDVQESTQTATPAPLPMAARITTPVPGTIVALDPDIPPANQRLRFEAAGPHAQDVRWHIDGKLAGRGAAWLWLPWPGRHQVQLLGSGGQVLDQIRIEVRGASVR